jgi:hypothetical protein
VAGAARPGAAAGAEAGTGGGRLGVLDGVGGVAVGGTGVADRVAAGADAGLAATVTRAVCAEFAVDLELELTVTTPMMTRIANTTPTAMSKRRNCLCTRIKTREPVVWITAVTLLLLNTIWYSRCQREKK